MKKDFVYLASASPRRSELLRQIGVRFTVRAAAIAEQQLPRETPEAYVVRLAAAKAEAVWAAVADAHAVLGADTAVVLDGEVLGKPETEAEAAAMLERLSGRAHRVLTAVALRHPGGVETRLSDSEVRFRATTADERLAYCRTGEPFDKAGGYAVQGLGGRLVAQVDGCYTNVVGLPVEATRRLLREWGI
jgi:septum formation protein